MSSKKVILLAAIGSALDYYDFMVMVFVSNIIGAQYFPSQYVYNSVLAVFMTFTVGYLMRPLGGIIFSHFGDKYGRRIAFYFSIILIAIPLFCIALLPTYQEIGVLAPILLIILRLIQGLAFGGELPGAVIYTFEHVDLKYRTVAVAFIFSILTFAALSGQLLVTLISHMLSKEAFYLWGWRLAFIIGSIFCIAGGYLRKNLSETPAFIALKSRKKTLPIAQLFDSNFITLIQGILFASIVSVSMFLIFIFMPIFLIDFTSIGNHGHIVNAVNLLSVAILTMFFGYISDKFGKKNIFKISLFCMVVIAYPVFWVVANTTSLEVVMIMIVLLGIPYAMMLSTYATIVSELFPTSVRYTGLGLVYNVSAILFGATAPMIVIWLIKLTSNPISVAFYLIFFSFLALLGFRFKT
ncbi:MFS transporter [Thiotrichales bacterium 19X7-9]|nr:MFS transporter [Thiotrichales bacterium 19X7-9]